MDFPSSFRSHQGSGVSSRSPPRPQGQDAPPLAARSEEMVLTERATPSLAARPKEMIIRAERPFTPAPAGGRRLFFWLAIISTVAAGAVYLIYTLP
jgi:hypothetical protein